MMATGRKRGAQPGNKNASGPHGISKNRAPGGNVPKGGMIAAGLKALRASRSDTEAFAVMDRMKGGRKVKRAVLLEHFRTYGAQVAKSFRKKK
jgi:hypothetical protein